MLKYSELLAHLATLQEHRVALGLARVREASERLGHPERAMPCVHIAGTNGKGSTLAFLRALLMAAGHRVGTFTSPHLVDYVERMAINGCAADGERLARIAERMLRETAGIPLTYFETSFLLAACYFAEQRPDMVLYETGLGGRLDATNIVAPQVVALTAMAMDHQQWLGADLVSIAREKVGIIKPGVPVVSVTQEPAVAEVIGARCGAVDAPLTWAEPVSARLPLGLLGAHQCVNAGLAVAVAEQLRAQGWNVGGTDALANAQWPGRLEWLSKDPPILFDGAHNVAGAQALAAYLKRDVWDGSNRLIINTIRRQGPLPVHCYLGLMQDKDAAGIISALGPVVEQFYTLTPPSPRALAADLLAAVIRAAGYPAESLPLHTFVAHTHARSECLCVVAGSLYLYRMVRGDRA